MQQSIAHVALVVRDYDEALDYYVGKLSFRVVEDKYVPEQDKRWVVISPPGSSGTSLLLARASKPEQEAFIGNQAGDVKGDPPELQPQACTFGRKYCVLRPGVRPKMPL